MGANTTSPDSDSSMPNTDDFLKHFSGRFENILRWPMLDELWDVLKKDSGHHWYVYVVGEAPPTEPVEKEKLITFIDQLDALLRKDHDENYCGIVYTDSRESPTFIKVFDPNHLGASCGSSGQTVLPAWVISQTPPLDLPVAFPAPRNGRRWWQGLFGL